MVILVLINYRNDAYRVYFVVLHCNVNKKGNTDTLKRISTNSNNGILLLLPTYYLIHFNISL